MFDLSDDIIDSRDIIERMEELRGMKNEWHEANGARRDEYTPETMPEEWTEELEEELANLEEIESAAGFTSDWTYGVMIIAANYFEDYCREQVVDCGYISDDLPGFIEIDWQATADNMRNDYHEFDAAGYTYLVQAY